MGSAALASPLKPVIEWRVEMGKQRRTKCVRCGVAWGRRPMRLCSTCRFADECRAAEADRIVAEEDALLPEFYRGIRWVYNHPNEPATGERNIWRALLDQSPRSFLKYHTEAERLLAAARPPGKRTVERPEQPRPLPLWWLQEYKVRRAPDGG